MRLTFNSTLVAIILTIAAIAIPCTAWYVAGSRATAQEADRIEKQMLFGAFKAAHGLAQRLGGHLEALRESESRRPFYHYEPSFHDPTSNCECASVTPSPLLRGPADPLILAHFQLDLTGRLVIPTLEHGQGISRDPQWVSEQQRVLAELRGLRPILNSMVCLDDEHAGGYAVPGTGVTLHDRSASSDDDSKEEEKRSRRALWQEAAEYGATYNIGEPFRLFSRPDGDDYANRDSPDFEQVKVGYFDWHTVAIGGNPTLMALRRVRSPAGAALQCFIISTDFVNKSLRGVSYYPGRFVSGDVADTEGGEGKVGASVALPGVDWRVVVDTGMALEEARERGAQLQAAFRRTFLGVTSASLLAGLCLIGVLWQTDRLARQRQRFAASAAHELRTPLAGLRVYGDMLAEGLGDTSKTRQYARQISAEAERLGRVVSNVLGYTRLERGSLHVRPQSGDLAATVRDCVGRFEAALEAAGAKVELAIDDPLPSIPFDRDAVFHILQNLLDNAEKYTRSAGDRTIRVSLGRNGGSVDLSVADRGPGVAAELRKNLFEPFIRTDSADQPAGLGLGLTMVKGLAKAHAGSVSYTDAAGGGAVFTVHFPVGGSSAGSV